MSDTISRILSNLEESDNNVVEKTASEEAAPSLLDTVRSVANSAKTAADNEASENTPASQLTDMAKEAQEAEQERLRKEAHYLGAVLADGFMERWAAYDAALDAEGVKSASANNSGGFEQGYERAVEDMTKQAEEEYTRGYQDQLLEVHKIASEIHYAGQATAHNIIQNSSNK